MLAWGASPYDVAKFLGDEIVTFEKPYAPLFGSCASVCGRSCKMVKDWGNSLAQIWRTFLKNQSNLNNISGQACKPNSVRRASREAHVPQRSFL